MTLDADKTGKNLVITSIVVGMILVCIAHWQIDADEYAIESSVYWLQKDKPFGIDNNFTLTYVGDFYGMHIVRLVSETYNCDLMLNPNGWGEVLGPLHFHAVDAMADGEVIGVEIWARKD